MFTEEAPSVSVSPASKGRVRAHRNALSESESKEARLLNAKAHKEARKAENATQRKAERAKNTAARALIRKREADLRDFHAYLDRCKHTRICNVCGERRNCNDIPDANRISLNDWRSSHRPNSTRALHSHRLHPWQSRQNRSCQSQILTNLRHGQPLPYQYVEYISKAYA